MKKYSIIFIIVVLFLIIFMKIQSVPSIEPYLAEDRNEKWINDITYIEKALPKVHKNLFFNLSEEDFKNQLKALKNKVPIYSDKEIEIELSKIIASVGDSHTGFNIGVEWMYPIELYWFKEGIYITGTTEKYKELLDAKIIMINNTKIEEAANMLKPLFVGANSSWFKAQVIYYLPVPSILKYFEIIDDEQIDLKVELASGEVKIIKMEPIKYTEYEPVNRKDRKIPLYQTHPSEYYWYEYLQDEKILYINYNRCYQMKEKPFEIFSKEVWDFAEKYEIEKLVIDLRDNRGGRSPIFEPFIKKLKKSEFNDENKLYVIIGRDTYSSAILNTISLKKETKAYFVGENTGGKPNHYGEVKKLQLPNNEDRYVRYSTKYFKWFDENTDTFKPDMTIEETFEDYIEGKDSALEWIIQHKKKQE